MPNPTQRPIAPSARVLGVISIQHTVRHILPFVIGVAAMMAGFQPLTPAYEGWSRGDRWCCLNGCGFAYL